MGNETVTGRTLEAVARQPEVSPYADIDNAALIVQYYEKDLDSDIAKELSVRLLTHAGYTGDPTTEPLIGRDGGQIQDAETGKPLTLADYVRFASEHHFYALEGILDFLYTKPGEPDYEQGRAAYGIYVNRP